MSNVHECNKELNNRALHRIAHSNPILKKLKFVYLHKLDIYSTVLRKETVFLHTPVEYGCYRKELLPTTR